MKLKCDEPLSNVAFKINLRRYGKVCYLTVQESAVTAQQSQRRPGLHIEAPPLSSDSSGINGPAGHLLAHLGGGCNPADGSDSDDDSTEELCKSLNDRPRDGIYMASNTPDSTSVYGALICVEPYPVRRKDRLDGVNDGDDADRGKVRPVNVNAHGDIEHLRETLAGRETHLLPDAIYWMTDRTPHESLPLQAGTLRQYFRLVTSKVGRCRLPISKPELIELACLVSAL